jgi:trimethylguanosine synthase
VTLLTNAPHRFLRLLASTPKIARRRRRRHSVIGVTPSCRPPLRTSEKRVFPIQSQTQTPSPTREAETPKCPEAEERSADAAAAAVAAEAVAGKYWAHRHSLFSLYDRGVRMDAEGWYSATPEAIAAAQAARAAPAGLVVDAFAGVGGNSIQFAARHAPLPLPPHASPLSVSSSLSFSR